MRSFRIGPLRFVYLQICLCFFSLYLTTLSEVLDRPQLLDSSRNRIVPIKIHLPDGPQEQLPLVLISHGAGGSRDGHYALAAQLSGSGYVVFCMEHVGSNTDMLKAQRRETGDGFLSLLRQMGHDLVERKNRPLDVRFALDKAKEWNRNDPKLQGRIDLTSVALVGHSYGAYTTLVCCGATPTKVKGQAIPKSEIALGIALSPQTSNGTFFASHGFWTVDRPMVFVTGNKDHTRIGGPATDRKKSFDHLLPGDKHLIWYEDANHFSFSDSTGSGRRRFKRLQAKPEMTESLNSILPAILDHYLRAGKALDKNTRERLIRASLRGSVKKIDWLVK